MRRRIAFVWDNFGPLHDDRCRAAATAFGTDAEIYGIELFKHSDTYEWQSPPAQTYTKTTLFNQGTWGNHRPYRLARVIITAVNKAQCDTLFFCHYDRSAILIAALYARLTGRKVFTMGCSKYDDRHRKAWREKLKRLFTLPYQGAIGSEHRANAYWRHLGINAYRIVGGYNTVDHARLRQFAKAAAEPPFAERPFLVVARLVPKKNLGRLLRAYAYYAAQAPDARRLIIAGNGPEERALRAEATSLGIASLITWTGFVQSPEIAELMQHALCLVLPSTEEQFGNVVAEALAFDLPVIASRECGASDYLIAHGESGYIFPADDHVSLGQYMCMMAADKAAWDAMRRASAALAARADSRRFGAAALSLAR